MMAFINRQFTANTCKANVVHDMARALAWFANKQLNAGNQRTIKELVVALPGVKAGLKHARKQTAKKDRDEDVDLQFGFTDALTLAREEEKGDKEQAIAALQRLADSAGKKGNSKSPDWKEVLRRLRNTDEEKKRKTEIEEERKSKKAKKAAGSGCEEE